MRTSISGSRCVFAPASGGGAGASGAARAPRAASKRCVRTRNADMASGSMECRGYLGTAPERARYNRRLAAAANVCEIAANDAGAGGGGGGGAGFAADASANARRA